VEFLTTCAAVAPSPRAASHIRNRRRTDREAHSAAPLVLVSNSRQPFGLSGRFSHTALIVVSLFAIMPSFLLPAFAQIGSRQNVALPLRNPAGSDSGLPTRVVYKNEKYLVTAGARGMTYTVAIEGNPSPIGMVIKMPNAPVKFQAFDNTLDTAETVKAVYAVFLNPAGDAGTGASSDAIVVTSFDPAKKEAIVQTSLGPVKFTNGLNDFDLMVGSNPVHGHFSDGTTAGQKAGHVLKSIGRSVSTFGIDSKQMYAGSVIEISMNHGPKSAFGEHGDAKDMGTSGGANAAGIKYAFQPAAGTVAQAAVKAADALGMDKPRYLPILNGLAGTDSTANTVNPQ
jgi:hypothetical protein